VEGRAHQHDLLLRSGTFLFLREDRAPAAAMRLGGSPVVPGNFGKEMARNETRFLERPPRGPWRRYGRKWPGFEKNPPSSLFSRSQTYHRARLLDRSVIRFGFFFATPRTVCARVTRRPHQPDAPARGSPWNARWRVGLVWSLSLADCAQPERGPLPGKAVTTDPFKV
jgi:hypothetical protein